MSLTNLLTPISTLHTPYPIKQNQPGSDTKTVTPPN